MRNPLHRQHGFGHVGLIAVIALLLGIAGFVAWRVYDAQKAGQSNNQASTTISGQLTEEDRRRLEEAQAQQATEQTTTTPTPTTTTPSNTTPSTTTTPGTPTTTNPTTPTPSPAPSSPYTRPTAAFCQEKNGNSFSAWATQYAGHTYEVWENGGLVNKTENGTAGYNYDSMKVVGVIPYHNKAAWATCSDKSGYLMYYYQPSGSVYTYNWLVPFEHTSVTEPKF